jgi:DNA-binding NarL/FixJ family response regulator
MRTLIQQSRFYEALDLEPPVVREPLPAAEAEVNATRALALAAAGRTDEAQRLVGRVRGLSRAVEPAVLVGAVDAITALRDYAPDALERVRELERIAFTRGALDVLVTAYRASPDLLSVLLRTPSEDDRLSRLIRRVRDLDLAEFVGYQVPATGDRRRALSPRERDVYDLLIQDLKNREIAKLLFIEESTVKAHTHRIYDKLGVRSRRGLIVQALLERSDQATSATSSNADDDSS